METINSNMNVKGDNKLRSLLFENEETMRRLSIRESEKKIESKRIEDLIKDPRQSPHVHYSKTR